MYCTISQFDSQNLGEQQILIKKIVSAIYLFIFCKHRPCISMNLVSPFKNGTENVTASTPAKSLTASQCISINM